MMLYTVMPLEVIFQEEEENGGYRSVNIGGVELEVEEISPGRGKIVRVISTDPCVFLNPSLQPGTQVQI